jgi:hypothetical protein
MGKYRKKPIVVEAIKWEGNYDEVCNFVGKCLLSNKNGTGNHQELIIPTLEGDHTALMGDYIIKGVHGEFYPIKEEIFQKTYEKVEEQE